MLQMFPRWSIKHNLQENGYFLQFYYKLPILPKNIQFPFCLSGTLHSFDTKFINLTHYATPKPPYSSLIWGVIVYDSPYMNFILSLSNISSNISRSFQCQKQLSDP